ncbi:MAG: hypothetical protein M1826_007369 [Phylliscum demangeonii]|nr:MAG: hypothetical protein M1826_007369 [Phylliscum demangeonii]
MNVYLHPRSQASDSSGEPARPLRRTPRLESSPSLDSTVGRASTSPDPYRPPPRLPPATIDAAYPSRPAAGHIAASRRDPAEDLRRAPGIDRRTAAAILYALEEALRSPFLFTPDLIEENAAMSDLVAGDAVGGSAGAGHAPTASNGRSRAGAAPYTAAGVKGPRDIMRERELRDARRKAAEREQQQRQRQQQRDEEEEEMREEEERRQEDDAYEPVRREEDQRIPPHTRGARARVKAPAFGVVKAPTKPTSAPQAFRPTAAAAAAAAVPATERPRELGWDPRHPGGSPPATATAPVAGAGGAGARPVSNTTGAGYAPKPVPPLPASAAPALSRVAVSIPAAPAATATAAGAAVGGRPPSQQAPEPPPARHPAVSSFPHAFERWETLSSHWEGLTSYWIRRLEANKEEVGREPLAQQMSRQITDLSAAGANLFHAVVELQRLRASSERKFQRWFFETRAEQERAREKQAELEQAVRRERQLRAEAGQSAQRTADKLVAETKRELQISKDEARRAWEELGRRVQEERDRTASLADGQPTIMGGIQVVPMAAADVGRHASGHRPSSPAAYAGTSPGSAPATATAMTAAASLEDPFAASHTPTPAIDPRSGAYRPVPGPTVTNGMSARAGSRTAAASSGHVPPPSSMAAGPSPAFYHHHGSSLHGAGSHRSEEEGTASDGEGEGEGEGEGAGDGEYEIDEHGHYRLDAHGRQILFRREPGGGGGGGAGRLYGEYGVGPSPTTTTTTTTTAAAVAALAAASGPPREWSQAPADYSGAEDGSGSGAGSSDAGSGAGAGAGAAWPGVARREHPTRLSDVMEEDERSRTSASRTSLNSRR